MNVLIYIYEHTHMHVVISLGMHHLSPAYDTFFLYTHVHPKSNASENRFQSPIWSLCPRIALLEHLEETNRKIQGFNGELFMNQPVASEDIIGNIPSITAYHITFETCFSRQIMLNPELPRILAAKFLKIPHPLHMLQLGARRLRMLLGGLLRFGSRGLLPYCAAPANLGPCATEVHQRAPGALGNKRAGQGRWERLGKVSNCIDGEICVLIFSVWVDHLAVPDVLIPFSKLQKGE